MTVAESSAEIPIAASQAAAGRIPLWVKVAYTAFVAVLVPYYLKTYGPTNFLYFCDVALLMTVAALWLESSLLASLAAVGILIPQTLWVADFLGAAVGRPLTGMTAYMFDDQLSLFARGLSFFHFWLPFLLLWTVWRLGYDRRALAGWTLLAWGLQLICFFAMPAPPAPADNPNVPVNINYVYGFNEAGPQTWMAPGAFLALMMAGLPLLIFLPTHAALSWAFAPRHAEFLSATLTSRGT
ncbi:MAG: hypothetical protein KDA44_15595 [Planctomycetales bacterium]|nr:hypothetical protein [Planctomycetales bacterium]